MKKQLSDKTIILVIIFIFLMIISYFQGQQRRKINEVKNLSFTNTNIEEVADGFYEGEIKSTIMYLKLKVQVENHLIKTIEVLDTAGSKNFDEKPLVERIISENKVLVEPIQRKELESLVFMCCVDNALSQGKIN